MQVSSLLAGTLGFAVKRASIPGLQRYLLDLDPYSDSLTEEFWETVCDPVNCSSMGQSHSFSSASMFYALQLFNCTLDYSKAQKWSKQRAKDANGTANGLPDGLCRGQESLAKVDNTYSDVSQLRITYRSVLRRLDNCDWVTVMFERELPLLAACTRQCTPWPTPCTTWSTARRDAAPSTAKTAPTSPASSRGR